MVAAKTELPGSFDEDVFAEIIECVSSGGTLRQVLRDKEISHSTWHSWIDASPDLLTRYARARERQAEAWSDEIVAVAYDAKNDLIEVERLGGTSNIEDRDVTRRAEIKVKTLTWLMARNHAARFGDRPSVAVNVSQGMAINGNPVTLEQATQAAIAAIRESREKLTMPDRT